MDGGGDTLVRHGYTVAELDRLARKAAWQSRWRCLPFAQREDIARFAIVEHLLTCARPPDLWGLVDLGEQAIGAQVERDVAPGTVLPRFWRYWWSAAAPTRFPEDRIVEALALAQIWPRLTHPHQVVLLALATHDDYEQAAALGRGYRGFVSMVSTARQQFLRLWHEHETPSQVWGRDRRGHHRAANQRSITTVTVRRRERRRRARQAEAAP